MNQIVSLQERENYNINSVRPLSWQCTAHPPSENASFTSILIVIPILHVKKNPTCTRNPFLSLNVIVTLKELPC